MTNGQPLEQLLPKVTVNNRKEQSFQPRKDNRELSALAKDGIDTNNPLATPLLLSCFCFDKWHGFRHIIRKLPFSEKGAEHEAYAVDNQ